jgi:predicted O-methyltransferase YrrM
MVELINPIVQQYAEQLTTPEDPLLKEISEFTLQHHPEAIMLSGHLQGKVLEMISCLVQPKRILEIGTFTGYSALCLAKGLAPDGLLFTIEMREEDADRARSYFDRSEYASQIVLHKGEATAIIPTLKEAWDLVFIDADKPAYIQYFNLIFPNLRKNGVIFADNIFFHGHVLPGNQPGKGGKSAQGIRDFNNYISQRTDIEKVALTIRDGLYLIRKR